MALLDLNGLLGGTTTSGNVSTTTSATTDTGLLGNSLLSNLLGSSSSTTVGNNGLLNLDLLGTHVAVLPDNGGLVSLDSAGNATTGGGLLDLGGLLGNNGLLNLTGLVNTGGGLLTGVLDTVTGLLGGGENHTDPNGNVDPSTFDKVFTGTDHRDTFTIDSPVSTYIDGKGDIDTVNFGRSAAGMSVAVGNDAVSFTDGNTEYYFHNVERVSFNEGTLYLDTGAGEDAGMAYRLYQAAFDRAPDNDGVKYWVNALDNGMSLHDAAQGFVNSHEFASTYGNLSDKQFVDQIYTNVLDRQADAAGEAYWVNYLQSGAGDRASTLAGFSESAENVATVGASIDHGFTLS